MTDLLSQTPLAKCICVAATDLHMLDTTVWLASSLVNAEFLTRAERVVFCTSVAMPALQQLSDSLISDALWLLFRVTKDESYIEQIASSFTTALVAKQLENPSQSV